MKTNKKQNEDLYCNLIQCTHEMIQSVKPDSSFIFVNNAWLDKLEYLQEELVSLTIFDIVHPDHLSYCRKILSRVMKGESVSGIETTFVTKDGKPILVEGNVVPRYVDNKVFGSLGFFRDVTERKKTEELLKQARSDLEVKVKKRTQELEETHQKLVETERLAMLGKMASAVAHELRNPLGVMKLAVYSLKKKIGPKDPNLVGHLENIDRKINESDQIIHDLLAFSRASELEFKPNDINESVNKGLEAIEQVIKENKVRVIRNLAPKLPTVTADFNQLIGVFSNMFLNAIQSMKESKEKELKVSTRHQDKFVEVEISDSGCGISKENLKKLGQPFFSTKTKGIGLGLYIVYEIVKKHKGEIKVESEVGKGTTFTVRLPLKHENTRT